MPVFAGRILRTRDTIDGWIDVEDGRLRAWGKGDSDEAVARGWIVPGLVNAHTHVADAFLRDVPGKPRTVAELVGPGGWKHRHLADAEPGRQETAVKRHVADMAATGTTAFIDFREQGVEGARWLRGLELDSTPVIFGRPAKPRFDEREAEALFAVVDGIGLSGIRDLPRGVLEAWRDACHDARVPFAFHAGEDKRDDIDTIVSLEPDHVVHMTQATPGDLETLAHERIPVVACPRSNAWFGMQSPVARMLEAGCTVALGTDNAMLQDGDLLQEAAAVDGVAEEAWLRMASHHGRALADLPEPSLERGATADWVVLPGIPRPARQRPSIAPNLDPEAWR